MHGRATWELWAAFETGASPSCHVEAPGLGPHSQIGQVEAVKDCHAAPLTAFLQRALPADEVFYLVGRAEQEQSDWRERASPAQPPGERWEAELEFELWQGGLGGGRRGRLGSVAWAKRLNTGGLGAVRAGRF